MIFRLVYPLALLLIPLPVIWWWLLRVLPFNKAPGELQYSSRVLLADLPITWRVRFRGLPDVLRALLWVVLVLAVARPQVGNTVEVVRGEGVDIVLILDISTSMEALDFEPLNRLEAAKSVIAEFVRGRNFDRIGLIVFARNAFHMVPPTLDHNVLLRVLEDVKSAGELDLPDGTAIGTGLASAGNMLRDSGEGSKVVVLLTDGTNTAGNLDPLTAARALNTLGIRVYTIGVGTIDPLRDEESRDLNEGMLRDIATIASGLYFQAENIAGLEEIYGQIDELEKSTREQEVFTRWQDVPDGLLISAFVLLLLERLLRYTVFKAAL